MKFVALSDTHLYRPEIPDGDVLIHAGDVCAYGTEKEFLSEIGWLRKLPHKHKLYIPGNHDRCVDSQLISVFRQVCDDSGIVMLIDDCMSINGLKVFGCPHTPEFMNWAFMYSSRGADIHWKRHSAIYADADIWVTHGPPRGMFDGCQEPVGCRAELNAVSKCRPRIHLFGHIHEGHGCRKSVTWADGSQTLFANVAVLDEKYRPAEVPFVFTAIERISEK